MPYENFNYDIKEKMPIWWSEDTFLEPINRYSQELIKDIVGGFLTNLGIMQPVQVWKTLPTEYSWIHDYIDYDNLLKNKQEVSVNKYIQANQPIIAEIPNSKRNRHGIIQLKLNGDYEEAQKPLKKITIKNAHQTITINNIDTMTDIKIYTEDQRILINGVERHDLVTGSFNKIYSQAKNSNYSELDVDDENKITYIEIESDTNVYFDLKIKHIHPIYVTEQNIRVHSVGAFPIEYIKLYGFFCHDYNNKQEWQFLWEKHYDIEDRVVYDRITKQFDCETFYIQVKLHGIGMPLIYGFPQEELHENSAFEINRVLDQWGKALGLPRRYYKTHISDEEEPFTFPPFYKYNIEQDYWYEQRLINEYKYNEDAINASYIKDTNLDNIALLQSIDPFIQDIYVYTETIQPSVNNNREVNCINPLVLESGDGITWESPHQISNTKYIGAEVQLKPKTSKFFNDKSYQTKTLELYFNDIPTLPKNINIQGIELKLHGMTDIHSNSLELDDRSVMILPTESASNVTPIIDTIPINIEDYKWEKGKGVYSIGGPTNLFGQEKISRNQIQNGLTFHIGFTNNNEFLKASIVLYTVQLFIYYEIIEDKYDIDVIFDSKEIILNSNNKNQIQMKIAFANTGTIPAINKQVFIAVPPELNITNKTFRTFDLDVTENHDNPFVIGETAEDQIIITSNYNVTGSYDVLVFCDDKVIKNEIIVKEVDINDIER